MWCTYTHTHTRLDLNSSPHTPAQGAGRELPGAPVWRRAVAAALGLRQLPLLQQHGGGSGQYDADAVPHPRVQRVLPVVVGHGDHPEGEHLGGRGEEGEGGLNIGVQLVIDWLPCAVWKWGLSGSVWADGRIRTPRRAPPTPWICQSRESLSPRARRSKRQTIPPQRPVSLTCNISFFSFERSHEYRTQTWSSSRCEWWTFGRVLRTDQQLWMFSIWSDYVLNSYYYP